MSHGIKSEPDPENIKTDLEQVFHYLKYRIGVKGQIGIMARSMGSIAATHLIQNSLIDLIIADRSFSDMQLITKNYI